MTITITITMTEALERIAIELPLTHFRVSANRGKASVVLGG
ncbi:hypothetical protein [Methylobacterium sp. CM6247]